LLDGNSTFPTTIPIAWSAAQAPLLRGFAGRDVREVQEANNRRERMAIRDQARASDDLSLEPAA
jgi:hypothetical protein